jgi:hypothetical protein
MILPLSTAAGGKWYDSSWKQAPKAFVIYFNLLLTLTLTLFSLIIFWGGVDGIYSGRLQDKGYKF